MTSSTILVVLNFVIPLSCFLLSPAVDQISLGGLQTSKHSETTYGADTTYYVSTSVGAISAALTKPDFP